MYFSRFVLIFAVTIHGIVIMGQTLLPGEEEEQETGLNILFLIRVIICCRLRYIHLMILNGKLCVNSFIWVLDFQRDFGICLREFLFKLRLALA